MTTVAQLIEYLKTLPPDAQVRVLEERTRNYETVTEWVDLEIGTDNCYHWTPGAKNYLDLGCK